MFMDALLGYGRQTHVLNIFLIILASSALSDQEPDDKSSPATPAMPGPSLTLSGGDLGVDITLVGSGLGTSGAGVPFGTVNRIEFEDTENGGTAEIILPFATDVGDMIAAIEAGSGPVTYDNYTEFYELLLPVNSGFNLIYTGGSGNETIEGFATNDSFDTGGGKDTLILGDGSDTFSAGAGRDAIDGRAVTGLVADLKAGTAAHDGGTTTFTSVEDATGGAGRDVLRGTQDRNTLEGKGGRDELVGRSGNDLLDGGSGNDKLLGGLGNDQHVGGKGNDKHTGGAGADTFFFKKGDGTDTITDFDAAEDMIEIGRGASRFGQLDIEQVNDNVEVSFRNVTIRLLDTDVDDIGRDVFDL